jgi:hypothetical protein
MSIETTEASLRYAWRLVELMLKIKIQLLMKLFGLRLNKEVFIELAVCPADISHLAIFDTEVFKYLLSNFFESAGSKR